MQSIGSNWMKLEPILQSEVSQKEKHQYSILTHRSMNQGKLEVVKQEMARVNVDILGISELKWTGMGALYSQQKQDWKLTVAQIKNSLLPNSD